MFLTQKSEISKIIMNNIMSYIITPDYDNFIKTKQSSIFLVNRLWMEFFIKFFINKSRQIMSEYNKLYNFYNNRQNININYVCITKNMYLDKRYESLHYILDKKFFDMFINIIYIENINLSQILSDNYKNICLYIYIYIKDNYIITTDDFLYELVSKITHPQRLLKLCNYYNYDFNDYIDIY